MAKCKTANVCGNRRKLCFTAEGKIKSNTPVGARSSGRSASRSKGKGGFAKSMHCKKHHKGYRWAKGGRCVRAAAC